MELLIDLALRRFFTTRADLFDAHSTFVAWKSDDTNFSWTDGYQSAALFGHIEYRSQDGRIRQSDPLVLKCSPSKSEFLFPKDFYVLAFFNEINFYTSIWPLFRSLRPPNARLQFHKKETESDATTSLFAECYHSQLEMSADDFSAVIVLANLQAQGFRSNQRRSFVDYPHLALMMRRLGEFHAYSYKARQSNGVIFEAATAALRDPFRIPWTLFHDKMSKVAARGMRPLLDEPKYARRLSNVQKMLENAYVGGADGTKDPNSVVCHGDYLRSNVLFRYDDDDKPVDLRMVDMANVKLAAPAYDLALPLYLHADQSTRAAHWDDLIDEYHDSLSGTFPGVRVPTRQQITHQFPNNCFHAYLIASYFLGQLIARDNNLPDRQQSLPHQYAACNSTQIPQQMMADVTNEVGGSLADTALTNILKDMIDRGFI